MWALEGLLAVINCATTGLFAGLTIFILAHMGLIPIIALVDEDDLEEEKEDKIDEDI